MSTDPPPSPFKEVAIVRFRPIFFALTAVILAGGAGLFLAGHPHNFAELLQMLLTSCSLVFGLSRVPRMRREVPVSIGVRDDHLLVDGGSTGLLNAISSAFVLPGHGEACALRLLRGYRPPIELRMRDQDHAVALMRALGLGPTQSATSYRLPPQPGDRRLPWAMWLVLGVLLAIFGGMSLFLNVWRAIAVLNVLFPLASVVGLFAFTTFPLTARLLVGTDGISLVFMGRTRFVPYGEISDVSAEVRNDGRLSLWWITIALTTGAALEFAVRPEAGTDRDTSALLGLNPHRIAERIREAKVAATSGAHVPPALLNCSGTPATRIRALRALGREGRQDYRTAPISTEQLWRIFESSSTDPEARAGAAVALRQRLDESCRRRLRIVAAATAAPKLRAAFEGAAGDDDDSLEEALAALEADVAEERAAQRVGAS